MVLRALWRRLFRKSGESRLFTSEVLTDPYPLYQRLRSEDPVHWEDDDERWMLTRYADVVTVLRSPIASSDRVQAMRHFVPGHLQSLLELRSNSMLNCDAPRHTRLRLLVNKAFTARAVEALTDKIRKLAESMLDAVQPRGRMDLMADLAHPFPVTVIAEMLGVPPEDRPLFKRWSHDLSLIAGGAGSPRGLSMEDYRRTADSFTELSQYIGKIVAQRRTEPRNDLLTALAQAEEAGDRLSEPELYANAALILVAGHETTTNLIGNGMLALLRHPDQMERLRRDPSLILAAVEEFLRYESPVQFVTRLLKEDLTLGGKQLRARQTVLMMLGAANRDPAQFPDPDRLDVCRTDNKHVAFGLGTHFCLGAQLARLEGRIVFETLLRRMPNLRLDAPEVKYRKHFNLRGLEAIPVAF
jgi:pimeloyl-[acyl-carrier protein] synthase